ncbi:MAG: LlaJI family restriction endonuclease, partial [Bacteroidetes bacterium]|nr:LlaJI family restriction endonuclease [Bacteroidota bacterium]
SECIRYLKDIENAGCNLFKLCDVNCDELTDAVIDDFGSTEYILYRLESEIRVQYITQKQNLLKLLHTYIGEKDNILQNDVNCSLFGSANFHWIWEDVCTSVFNDKSEFKDKINKPEWNISDKNGKFKKNEEETLKPDIIVEEEMEDGKYFGIFDAKYYCIDIDENCKIKNGQLGVGDIIKQYFYQISFKDYILNNKCKYIQNVFLFPDFVPAKNNKYSSISYVTMETFEKVIKDLQLGSGKIIIVWLDTKDMYKKYLKGDKITGNDIFKYIPGMTKRLIK